MYPYSSHFLVSWAYGNSLDSDRGTILPSDMHETAIIQSDFQPTIISLPIHSISPFLVSWAYGNSLGSDWGTILPSDMHENAIIQSDFQPTRSSIDPFQLSVEPIRVFHGDVRYTLEGVVKNNFTINDFLDRLFMQWTSDCLMMRGFALT